MFNDLATNIADPASRIIECIDELHEATKDVRDVYNSMEEELEELDEAARDWLNDEILIAALGNIEDYIDDNYNTAEGIAAIEFDQDPKRVFFKEQCLLLSYLDYFVEYRQDKNSGAAALNRHVNRAVELATDGIMTRDSDGELTADGLINVGAVLGQEIVSLAPTGTGVGGIADLSLIKRLPYYTGNPDGWFGNASCEVDGDPYAFINALTMDSRQSTYFNIDNDKFSIIITRHPIDVLRMSDFDTITSCHSPASRQNAYQSYYKCAVAEAQGHGAVAYVVETEDLLSATNTSNIDSAEQEIQEGEIFVDDKRPFSGDIEPISRTRIRHVRYYEGDEPPKRWDDGQDVGMPEKRVYGVDIPGLVNRVTDWARASQEEVIANMPKNDNGIIDLNKFMIFGGSYEDTANAAGRERLMRQLLGAQALVSGNMKQNTDTEDDLDANLVGDIIAQYEGECEEIMNEYNNRMAQTYSDYEVGDDGGEGAFIRPFAAFIAKWPVDEWKRLPGNQEEVVWNSVDEIIAIYGDIFEDSSNYTPVIRRIREEIHLTMKINFEHPDIYGNGYMAMPEEYREALENIDVIIDDRRDQFEAVLTDYFKREGQMEGGEFMNLAVAIEDGVLTSYEWDLETDGQYSESYECTARYTHYYDPEDLGLGIEVLKQIVDSRDFRIELRKQLLEAPREEQNTQYYLNMDAQTLEQGVPGAREINMTVEFSVNADAPDIMTALFVELVEGEMDDEDNLKVVFNRVLAQFVNSRKPAFMQTNENLVKTWKGFLYD